MRLESLSLQGKKVVLRVDFNVPLTEDGKVQGDARIRAALPTIRYILEKHPKSLLLLSHLGRPKGKDPKMSLAPCAKRLSELLSLPVAMAPDCIGEKVEAMTDRVIMLENVRFYEGEEDPSKDPSFVEKLARLGDVYVNDAFGAAHRAHASTSVIAGFFRGKSALGFLMREEILQLSSLLKSPERPFFALIGGAKVSSKIGILKSLLKRVDALYIGGALAFPFLQAQGKHLGACRVAVEEEAMAKEILSQGKQVFLPRDLCVTSSLKEKGEVRIVSVEEGIPSGWFGVDVGHGTVREWGAAFRKTKTVFWNGPLGIFETKEFAKGTFAIAEILAECGAKVVIGGGDSLAAIEQMGIGSQFAYLSTGGGASLEFLEHEGHLPGIDAIE